jgi:hypothetical protein
MKLSEMKHLAKIVIICVAMFSSAFAKMNYFTVCINSINKSDFLLMNRQKEYFIFK